MSIRYYYPSLLFEVSTRTVAGAYLLDPVANPEVGPAFHAIIARAQAKYGVKVYAYFAMSNHYHAIYGAADPDAMADFLCAVHAAMARYANRVLGRYGPVFAGRCDVRPILPGDKALPDRVCYIMGQAMKTGEQWTLDNWPGANTNRALMYGELVVGRHFDQHQHTLDKRRKDGPNADEAYTTTPVVKLSVLPCWSDLPESEIRAKYQAIAAGAMVRFSEGGTAQKYEIAEQSHAGKRSVPPPVPPKSPPLTDEAKAAMLAQRPKPAAVRQPHDRRRKKLAVHADTLALAEAYVQAYQRICGAHAQAREDLATQTRLALLGQQAKAVRFPLYTFAAAVRTARLALDLGLTSTLGGDP
ncbi:MAG: hypothetical protein EXR77_10665 [Myxococcales bacterium]|nr:hypothetical protein [Myxococcales bacterium]